jgi:hypothetical protein
VLKGDRVHGWKLSGFGTRDALPKSIDMPLAESGVIAQAATGARPVTSRDASAGDGGPGFEPLADDRMGMAMPVLIGGKVVAIVYADAVAADGHPRSVPSAWPEVIEVLARHAGRCLEALTAQKAVAGASRPRGAGAGAAQPAATAPAQADSGSSAMRRLDESLEGARRLARLLVSEIRLNHGSAVSQGCRDRNLLARLAPEIERARDTYASRVPDGADSREVFRQELVRTLAGGDASLLGAAG